MIQVSPHELFQAISVESNRKYRRSECMGGRGMMTIGSSDVHSDPAEFLNWFLNRLARMKCYRNSGRVTSIDDSLHRGLGGSNKRNSSVIHKVFQGLVSLQELEARSQSLIP